MPATAIQMPGRRAERIAFLTDQFPVLSETFIGNEIRAVERYGRQVEVISFRRPDGAFQPIDADLARRTVYLDPAIKPALIASPTRWLAAWRFAREQRGLSVASLMRNGARVARVLQDRRIDHVHAHFAWGSAAHAIVAARLAGVTVSFVGHGSDVYGTPTDLPAKLRNTDLAIATCEDTRLHFRSLARGTPIATVACGIDADRFQAVEAHSGPNRGLIFVARLIERKGLRETLLALSELPAVRRPALDIVGDGPERADLEALTADLGLADVRFLGPRTGDWISRNLPSYRALVAPYFEGLDGGRDTGPLVAKEALASAVPVIASSFMGLKEIVDPTCGIVVPPRDVPALASAIAEAADWSSERWGDLGRAGRRKVIERFTDRKQATDLCAAFDGLQGTA